MRARNVALPLVLVGSTLGTECAEMVTVEKGKAVTVVVSPSSLVLDVGEVAVLVVAVANAHDLGVTWSSSNDAVATVDENGLVSAWSPGVATVTVTSTEDPLAIASTAVNVNDVHVEISSASLVLQPQASALLTCRLRGTESGDEVTGVTFAWSSSAPQVAEVDADGTVTAISDGTASVTCVARIGETDYEASATVTVTTEPIDECSEFGLRVDFDPIQVAPGANDVLAVFVDRVGGFAGRVEVMLADGAGGTQPSAVLSLWEFDPNFVQFQPDPDADDTLTAVLYFQVRPDVAAGSTYELSIVGGSPTLAIDPDGCRLPVSFEVIG